MLRCCSFSTAARTSASSSPAHTHIRHSCSHVSHQNPFFSHHTFTHTNCVLVCAHTCATVHMWVLHAHLCLILPAVCVCVCACVCVIGMSVSVHACLHHCVYERIPPIPDITPKPQHTYTHTHTHARTHARTHAVTHTHAHTHTHTHLHRSAQIRFS